MVWRVGEGSSEAQALSQGLRVSRSYLDGGLEWGGPLLGEPQGRGAVRGRRLES